MTEVVPETRSQLGTAVHVRLITETDIIERNLVDRVHVKVGRQVKTVQEKLLLQLAAEEGNQETPVDGMNQDTLHPLRTDAQAAIQTTFMNAPNGASPEKPASPTSNTVSNNEAIWFKSKVVSRSHAEIWLKDGQVYLRDSGSSSGTFLNKMRLSPANRMSRPYALREGDVVRLGVDYQGRSEEIYKSVEFRVSLQVDETMIQLQREIPFRFKQALHSLLKAANPYATSKEHDSKQEHSVDCCICIGAIGPFQALFIAPCSHCFHYKCIQHILKETIMFPCPVCRQVANLEATVSMESLGDLGNDWKNQSHDRSRSILSESEMEHSNPPLQELVPSQPLFNLQQNDQVATPPSGQERMEVD